MKLKIRQFLDFVLKHSDLVKTYVTYVFLILFSQIFIKAFYLNTQIESFTQYIDLIYLWGLEWDGLRYYNIFLEGYKFPDFAFFPGYILLLEFFSNLIPIPALFIRFNLFLIFFLMLSLSIFMDSLGINKKDKLKTLVLFFSYPFSIFLTLGYSETIYILISIWILYFLNSKTYLSALLSFFLGLFKITALIMPLIILVNYIKSGFLSQKLRLENLKNWIWYFILSVISVLGVVLYFIYLEIFHKSFLIFFYSQADWGRLNPKFSYLEYIRYVINNPHYSYVFSLIFEIVSLIFILILLVLYFKRLKIEYYLYSALHILIPLATGTAMSINRFTLLCFPILLVFFSDIAKDNKKFKYVLIFFVIFYIFNTILLANQIFIG